MSTDENRIMHILDNAADLEEQIAEAESYIRIKYLEIGGKKQQLEHLKELYYRLCNEELEANQTKL